MYATEVLKTALLHLTTQHPWTSSILTHLSPGAKPSVFRCLHAGETCDRSGMHRNKRTQPDPAFPPCFSTACGWCLATNRKDAHVSNGPSSFLESFPPQRQARNATSMWWTRLQRDSQEGKDAAGTAHHLGSVFVRVISTLQQFQRRRWICVQHTTPSRGLFWRSRKTAHFCLPPRCVLAPQQQQKKWSQQQPRSRSKRPFPQVLSWSQLPSFSLPPGWCVYVSSFKHDTYREDVSRANEEARCHKLDRIGSRRRSLEYLSPSLPLSLSVSSVARSVSSLRHRG